MDGQYKVAPFAVLEHRIFSRKGIDVPQALIQWDRDDPKAATWEDLKALSRKFPEFADPWGQGSEKEGCIVMTMEQPKKKGEAGWYGEQKKNKGEARWYGIDGLVGDGSAGGYELVAGKKVGSEIEEVVDSGSSCDGGKEMMCEEKKEEEMSSGAASDRTRG